MVAVQRCGSSVAIVQQVRLFALCAYWIFVNELLSFQILHSHQALLLQYFANSISRLLLPVDGAHAASCEEMATAMSIAEGTAHKGLNQCIETVMAEVCA